MPSSCDSCGSLKTTSCTRGLHEPDNKGSRSTEETGRGFVVGEERTVTRYPYKAAEIEKRKLKTTIPNVGTQEISRI